MALALLSFSTESLWRIKAYYEPQSNEGITKRRFAGSDGLAELTNSDWTSTDFKSPEKFKIPIGLVFECYFPRAMLARAAADVQRFCRNRRDIPA